MVNEIKKIYITDYIRLVHDIPNPIAVNLDVDIPKGYVLLVTSEVNVVYKYGISIYPSPLILTCDDVSNGSVEITLRWDGIDRQNYIDWFGRLTIEASENEKIHIANGILIKLASE